MPISINLKKKLHRPQFEQASPVPAVSAAGSFVRSVSIPAYGIDMTVFCVNTTSAAWLYSIVNDAYLNLPTGAIAGTFGAGSCGRILPLGPTGTATATNGTNTITTNLTLLRDLRGYIIRLTAGPGAGEEHVIKSNTIGANAIITLNTNAVATMTTSTQYQLMTPRLWVFNPAATPGLGYYDWALSAWVTGKSVTNLSTGATMVFTVTDGLMVHNNALLGASTDWSGGGKTFSSATNVTTGTLVVNNVGWTTNQWKYGYISIVDGTGVGQVKMIGGNTTTTAGVGTITLATNVTWSVQPDATSVYVLYQPFDSIGAAATGGRGQQTSSATSVTTTSTQCTTVANSTALTVVVAPLATVPLGAAVAVNGVFLGYLVAYGTFTGANTGTCTVSLPAASLQTAQATTFGWGVITANSGTNWATNQWAGWAQVRIVAGTGAGQIRRITQNTATTLTVAPVVAGTTPWVTTPDTTSVFVIEGDDDNLWLAGNAAVTLFRYSIANNTWFTASASAARAAVTGAGLSLNWPTQVGAATADPVWDNPDLMTQGRYLWSFRGAAGNVLDKYDMAWATSGLGTWISGIAYGDQGETFTTGTCYEYDGGNLIYIMQPTGVMKKFDVLRNGLFPAGYINYTQGAGVVGDKLFMTTIIDQATKINKLYSWRNSGQELFCIAMWQGDSPAVYPNQT